MGGVADSWEIERASILWEVPGTVARDAAGEVATWNSPSTGSLVRKVPGWPSGPEAHVCVVRSGGRPSRGACKDEYCERGSASRGGGLL